MFCLSLFKSQIVKAFQLFLTLSSFLIAHVCRSQESILTLTLSSLLKPQIVKVFKLIINLIFSSYNNWPKPQLGIPIIHIANIFDTEKV